MSDVTILLADNDADALQIYGEYLESAGYHVLKASNPVVARNILDTHRVHLAILDLRLTDDLPSDRSGLALAKEIARTTPKLILTKWPTYKDVREALRLDEKTLPPAVDFLDKGEGLVKLGEVVKQILLKYVRINRELIIQADETQAVSFLRLIELLSPGLPVEFLQEGAEELEDLFRRLFYEKSQIKIDRLLWQNDRRVALVVFAFALENATEALVVVVGNKAKMEKERVRYREFAPQAPGHNSTVLSHVTETEHFAAHSYALAGAHLERVASLEQLYRTAPERVLGAALSALFDKTLAEWHEEKLVAAEGKTAAKFYAAMLNLPAEVQLQTSLEKCLESIAHQLPALGVAVRRTGDRLTIDFGKEKFTYPDLASHLTRLFAEEETVLLLKTPGMLLGQNILAERTGNTWLTDFASAGLAPALWNYASLESVVRFDWVEPCALRWLHEMELVLGGPEFTKLYASGVEAPLRKTVRTVVSIRRLGVRSVARQQRGYDLGILFHAVSRLLDYRPALQLTNNELTRFAHLLFSSTMILDRLLPHQHIRAAKQSRASAGIQIDHANRAVWINGINVHLRGQSYELLHELYLHANELCPRGSIFERVFGEKYEETNESQANRLNTAMRRLREKIEEDPDSPRFLMTEPHRGYRLIPQPGRN